MPIFEHRCEVHGDFEVMVSIGKEYEPCPECKGEAKRIMSLPAHSFVKFPERMRYGSGSPGRIINGKETGGLDIFIPSGGAMDKAEIDDVACAAIEKEKGRVKKLKGHARSNNAEAIGALTQLAYRNKPGQRIKVLNEAITETGLGSSIKVA